LIVTEGNLVTISNSSLFLKTKEADEFVYRIETSSSNGDLVKMNMAGKNMNLKAGDSFTTQEIAANLIFYQHDDSETTNDTFRYEQAKF